MKSDVNKESESKAEQWTAKLRNSLHIDMNSGQSEPVCAFTNSEPAFGIQVDGKHGPGRPQMIWRQLTERDCRKWMLSAINPHDRDTWRSDVRSAMQAASQLPGRGPTDVDVAPVPAC